MVKILNVFSTIGMSYEDEKSYNNNSRSEKTEMIRDFIYQIVKISPALFFIFDVLK